MGADGRDHGEMRTGRTPQSGATNGRSRLTEEQAREILDRATPLTETYGAIAADYPITRHGVRQLVKGATWAHLHEERD